MDYRFVKGEVKNKKVAYTQNGDFTMSFSLFQKGKVINGKETYCNVKCNIYRPIDKQDPEKANHQLAELKKYDLLVDGMEVVALGYESTKTYEKFGEVKEFNQFTAMSIYTPLGFTPMNQKDVQEIAEAFKGTVTEEALPFA